jgi:2-keto-3-deoxy-L-rhamnonate aldolase RhmA
MNLVMQTIPSSIVSDILCNSELDGIILDTEHGCFNNETLYSCIQIITLHQKKCFVRFTDLNKQLVRMCLDAGIDGVIFSTLEHVEYAHDIIKYCTYPSQGGKRGCGLVRENKWGNEKLDKRRPIIMGQIETRTAIEKISELYEESNLDFYIIGPYDISSSLNIPGQFDNPIYLKYLNSIYDNIPLDKLGMFLPYNDYINLSENQKQPHILILGLDTDIMLHSLKNIKK